MQKKSPLAGRKQSPQHIAKRSAAMVEARRLRPWKAGRPENTPEVLWSKVAKGAPDECWPWIGKRHEGGYGRVEIRGRNYYAHRVIYDLANPGKITLSAPRDMRAWGFLRHTCDNPSCCNPGHLVPGTQLENMEDAFRKGRAYNPAPSYKWHNAKLTPSDVRFIRDTHAARGFTKRQLAEKFNVSIVTIKGVLSRRHYADVI